MKSLYFSWMTKAYCSLVGLELGTPSVAPTPLKGKGGLDMQFEEVVKESTGPGESGLVSRGSQGLRSPLESRRGSLGAP